MKKMGKNGSITLLLILRALYAMNWYNVSPLLFKITSTYGVSPSYSGLVLSAFLIGTGFFQIPSGLVATKIGSRNTALTGMVIMSVAATLSIISINFTELLVTRFFVGLGSAFFFSSGIAVLNDIDSTNVSRNIAAFNTAFSIGGGFGVVGFAYFSGMARWQTLIGVSGLVTLVVTMIGFIFIVNHPPPAIIGNFRAKVKERMTSRPLLLLSMSLAGYWGLNFTLEEYLQPFATNIGFNSHVAGIIGSLSLFAGLLGMVLYGVFSKRKSPIILPSLGIFISSVVAVLFFKIPVYLFATSIIAGTCSVIIFSLEYTYVVRIEKEKEYVALGISIMNAMQIATGSLITLVFGLLFSLSISFSWIALALIAILLIPLGIPVWKIKD